MVLALIFLCKWTKGEPKALEDTIDVKWIDESELDKYEFPINVKEYLINSFKEIQKLYK